MNLKELRTKRDALANTARGILAKAETEGRSLNDAETRDFDGVKAKIDGMYQSLDRAAQLVEMRADIERPVIAGPVVHQDGDGMSYVQRNNNPGEVRVYKPNEAISESRYGGPGIGSYVRGMATGKWNGAEELRVLGEGGAPGSYLVPTPLSNYMIDLVRNQAQVMRAGAVTVPMESATFKMARQTGDIASNWKAENSAMTFSDANFNVVTFTSQMLIAGTKVSIEIVEDAPNLDAILGQSITKSLALALDYAGLYGSGSSNQPTGGIKKSIGRHSDDAGYEWLHAGGLL